MTTVIDHFDRQAKTGSWSNLYAVTNGKTYHFHVRRQRVLELLPSRLGRVVDVGCGPGVMVDAVLERGGSFDGIDLSAEMIQAARERCVENDRVHFRTGDAEKLDIKSESVDQVICMAVIEYLSTPDKLLAEIVRVLRPGGVALITVPKRTHIDHLTLGVTKPLRAAARALGLAGNADHLPRLCMNADELDAAAARAGLHRTAGALYYFTPVPYPLTRIAPELSRRVNVTFERFHQTRSRLMAFLAHGYIGRYEKR